MEHDLVIVDDPAALAEEAASLLDDVIRAAHARGQRFTLAVSGGNTPWAMFTALAERDLPWETVRIFQTDERVAPDGDPDRNLTHLRKSLGVAPAEVVPMPVASDDLDLAASNYAESLPARFDLVHLGLGADGHTASLVPEDPVLHVEDRPVALTAPYQGHRRMTLTYPGLSRADRLLWLVAGAEKADALRRLLGGDGSIPAARVEARSSLILADEAAASALPARGRS